MGKIRTVFFPTWPIKPLMDDKGKVRSRTREDVVDELDLFLYKNKITREQIVTIQFSRSDYAAAYTIPVGTSSYDIMLVYETKEGKQ